MHIDSLKIFAILVVALFFAGCGASIELQRGDVDLAAQFESSVFYLIIDDKSESKPDNWDGHVNLIWTSDDRRKEVVSENLQFLKDGLTKNGFIFVEDQIDSSVHANLSFKSVRFDPVGGWLTDDAQITYRKSESGEELGTVVADEIWFTPTVKMVFTALVEGSLELWGRSSGE